MKLYSKIRPSTLPIALAIVLLGAVVVSLTRADDPTTPPSDIAVTLKGHAESVYSTAFTPDGKYVVTGSFDKTIKVWEAATGKEFKTFGGPNGHTALVLSVAVSPDGTLVASGSTDNTVKIWDFPSANALRDYAMTDAVNAVALSPDGTKLAGAGKDGLVKLWNAADAKELFSMAGHAGAVLGVAFSANGQLLASSGADKTLRFWNPATGQPIAVVGAHPGAASAVALSPTGTAAYTGGDDGVLKFWTLPPAPAKPLAAPHADAVTALALSADGASILTGSADKTVRLSTAATGAQVRVFPGLTAAVTSVALGGTVVAAGTVDQKLFLWNAADAAPIRQVVAHAGPVTGVSFNAQGTQLLTAGGDGLLKLWALPATPTRVLTHPDAVTSAVVSADGKHVFTAGADKIVRSWDPTKPQQAERVFAAQPAPTAAVAVNPGGTLLASAGDDGIIRFWNQTNGQQAETIGAHDGAVTSLSFNAANQLVSASADGSVKAWQLPAALPKLFAHADKVTAAVLSPDGAKLLTGCADKQARLWNLATGAMERAFPGPTLAVSAVAFDKTGANVAAGSADKSLTVWTAADAKVVKAFPNLPAAVQAVAFSPDGKFVAAGLADNSIHIFDLAMGKDVKTLAGPPPNPPPASGEGRVGVTALAYTAKGELVSGSADKTVQVWDVDKAMSKLKMDAGAAVTSLDLSKDGARAVSGCADKTAKVWTLADGKPAATVTTPAVVNGVGFNADASRVVVAGADNRARVYGLDGKMLEFYAHDGPVVAAAFQADGKHVVTASDDKAAKLWTSTLLWQAGHAGPVRQALFTPKGDRVVSCGDDKTVQIWNAADGKSVKAIPAHEGAVAGVAASANGTKIVSIGADKALKVWTLAAAPGGKDDDKPVTIPLAAAASAVAVTPDGKRVAAAVTDATATLLHVYDTATGKEVLSLADHAGAVKSLAFLADNRTLVSASADKTARLSDVNVLAVIDAHVGGVSGCAFLPDGVTAVSGGADKTVKLWNLATGQATKTFGPLPDAVSAVAVSKDGLQVGATAGKTVKTWTVADGKDALTLTHAADVAGLSFSADKTKIATAGADSLVHVWDAATSQEIQSFPHAGAVKVVAFLPNVAAVVAGGADKTVTIETLNWARSVSVGSPILAVTPTPDGARVLTASADGKVKLWNATTGANERAFEGADKPTQAVAASKTQYVATGGADQMVRLYNFPDGKLLAAFKAPGPIHGLAFSANGQMLAAACEDKSIQTWSILPPQNGLPLTVENVKPSQGFAHAAAVEDVTFSPDGTTLYTAGADKAVKAWKIASEAATKTFQHPSFVDAVAFNNNGTQLATGCHDGKVRIWDVVKGMSLKEINAHMAAPAIPGQQPGPAPVYCVAWSADGKQVLSGSLDTSLKLWDAASGNLVKEFKGYKEKEFEKGHHEGVFTAAFSPDGKSIVSGSSDRAIKVWNVADGSVTRDLVNPNLKPGAWPMAHPGWVYGMRFLPDGRLVSVGGAPRNHGFLATWDVNQGKLLTAEELPLGMFFSVAVSTDGQFLAVGTSPEHLGDKETKSYVLKTPKAN